MAVTLAACSPGGGDGDEAAATVTPTPLAVVLSPEATAAPMDPESGAEDAVSQPQASPTLPVGPPVVPTPGRSSTPFRSAAAAVGPVVWATAIDSETKAPTRRVTTFSATAPALYATLPVERLQAGTTLEATWRYNGTPLDSFLSTVTADAETTHAWVEFHITRSDPAPWPTGVYEITVTVEGEPAQTAAVAVEAPPA